MNINKQLQKFRELKSEYSKGNNANPSNITINTQIESPQKCVSKTAFLNQINTLQTQHLQSLSNLTQESSDFENNDSTTCVRKESEKNSEVSSLDCPLTFEYQGEDKMDINHDQSQTSFYTGFPNFKQQQIIHSPNSYQYMNESRDNLSENSFLPGTQQFLEECEIKLRFNNVKKNPIQSQQFAEESDGQEANCFPQNPPPAPVVNQYSQQHIRKSNSAHREITLGVDLNKVTVGSLHSQNTECEEENLLPLQQLMNINNQSCFNQMNTFKDQGKHYSPQKRFEDQQNYINPSQTPSFMFGGQNCQNSTSPLKNTQKQQLPFFSNIQSNCKSNTTNEISESSYQNNLIYKAMSMNSPNSTSYIDSEPQNQRQQPDKIFNSEKISQFLESNSQSKMINFNQNFNSKQINNFVSPQRDFQTDSQPRVVENSSISNFQIENSRSSSNSACQNQLNELQNSLSNPASSYCDNCKLHKEEVDQWKQFGQMMIESYQQLQESFEQYVLQTKQDEKLSTINVSQGSKHTFSSSSTQPNTPNSQSARFKKKTLEIQVPTDQDRISPQGQISLNTFSTQNTDSRKSSTSQKLSSTGNFISSERNQRQQASKSPDNVTNKLLKQMEIIKSDLNKVQKENEILRCQNLEFLENQEQLQALIQNQFDESSDLAHEVICLRTQLDKFNIQAIQNSPRYNNKSLLNSSAFSINQQSFFFNQNQ